MSGIKTHVDPETQKLVVTKSGGAHPFLTGRDVVGGSATSTKLNDPYKASVWVNAAIKIVVNQLTSVSLTFSEDSRLGKKSIDDPELNQFWMYPAVTSRGQKMSHSDFLFATAAWYKLRGNAFWIMDDTWLDVTGRVKKNPLIVARPDSMRPVCKGGRGKLLAWRYTDASGRTSYLLPEQVIHFRAFNPSGDIMGLAEWEVVRMAAESDYAAAKFSKTLMDNNGDRGSFVIAKDGVPSDPQREQIERLLLEKKLHAQRGEHKSIFLAGNIDVQDPAIQSVDAAFISQRMENRHEIYIGLGVPASFAEVRASYSIGSASDRFRLLEETCMPLGEIIENGMEVICEKLLNRPVYVGFDWDEHSTMQEVRAERIGVAKDCWDRGVPWTVLNEHLNLQLPEFDGMDVPRVPFSMRAVGSQSRVKGQGSTDEGEEKSNITPETDMLRKLFAKQASPSQVKGQESRVQHDETKNNEAKVDEAETKEDFERDAEEVALWESLQAKRKPWEKQFENRFSRLLFSARAETLSNINQHYKPIENTDKSIVRKTLLELIFSLTPWMERILQELGQLSEAAIYQAGGEIASEELGLDEAPQLPSAAVQVALQRRENMLSKTATDIWLEVKDSIFEGIDNGDSEAELAKRVREKFNGISRQRSLTIARTETAVAYETGRNLTMKEAGVTHKKWLTAGDERVRLSHWKANGQVVGIDEMFTVGNVEMMHPADPNAPAGEVINCRCVSIADLGD